MNAKPPFRFLTDTSEQLDGPALAVFARRAEHHAGRHRGEDRLGARGRGRAVRELELNTYPTGGPMVLTSNARAEAARRADQIRERTGVGLTVEEVLESPLTFIGSIKELTRKVLDLREHLASARSCSTTWRRSRRSSRSWRDAEFNQVNGVRPATILPG